LEDYEMTVLVVYVLLVAVFEVFVVILGIAVDSIVPAGWNVVTAMVMFFAVIWGMWPVSVYITERWFDRPEKSAARVQPLH
jgi:hypothetical protein